VSVRESGERLVPHDGDRGTDQLHRLAAAALLLNSTLSLDELLQVVTAQAREAVGAHQAITSLSADAGTQSLTTVAMSEKYADWRDFQAPANGTGVHELVRDENRPLRLTQEELEAHPVWQNAAGRLDGQPPLRGLLAVPLVGRDGGNLGLIQLSDKSDGGDFTHEDEVILVQLAQIASAAVENARLYAGAQRERDRLAVVHRMAEEIGRAASLEELFDAALAGVAEAVGVDRSAILLLDTEGVMRFRAWRGLSDAYRAAVEGHSPWGPDDADAEPVLVPDVAADPSLRELRPVLEREGIRAAAFVPLVHGDRLIGKHMLYYAEPHEFAPDEVQLVRTIASHIASATERRRVEDELRSSRAELQAIFRGVADGISVQDQSGRVVYVNDAAARLIGFPDAE
jgi:GAF domain-containing protein